MPKQATPQEHKTLPIYIVSSDDALGIIDAVVNIFGIIDLGDDVIHNGAYTKTLNERGNQVKVRVLDSHNTDSIQRVIGKPLEIREIGRDELARLAPQVIAEHPEATGGLFTRTQFLLNTHEGDGAYKRLAAGAVDEWSIALDALQVEYGKAKTPEGKEKTVRHIYQIKLYEYSPVIWGMNQATVTTAVKSGDGNEPEADKDAPVPESEKRGSLSAKLEANMRMGYAYCVNDWLSYGLIDPETITILDGAMAAGMNAFRIAIPTDIALTELEYYNADGATDTKAGRVISARNRTTLQTAIDALQALLDADAPDEVEEDEEKASTGPEKQNDVLPVPSISAAAEVVVDTADIERELAEVSLMMEMEHGLQGDG